MVEESYLMQEKTSRQNLQRKASHQEEHTHQRESGKKEVATAKRVDSIYGRDRKGEVDCSKAPRGKKRLYIGKVCFRKNVRLR